VSRIRWFAFLSGLLILAALRLAALTPSEAEVRFTILHTNDLHGKLLPFTYTERGRGAVERDTVGGAARRASVIRRLRRLAAGPSVLVDAGDVFTRGPLTNAYEGVADVAAMNAAGYDLAAIGNNEFKARDAGDADDWRGSQAALLRVVRRSRFPWICANLTDGRGAFVRGVRPYVVKRVAGLRVGFLGVTAPRSAGYPQTRGWSITDPIAAAKEWVPRVRRQCDVLIALTHIGYALDQQLAAGVDGIDAVVGGDSHTFLYEPTWATGPSGRRVPIVQDGEFGVNVGRLDLAFRRSGHGWGLAAARGELVPVVAAEPEAPDVKRALMPYVKPFLQAVGSVGDVGGDQAERARATTSVVVRAIRRATHADLALNPLGAGLIDVFHRRVITRYDLYSAMPFANRAVVVLMSGADIRRVLSDQPETVVAGDTAQVTDGRTYRVAMVDFVASSVYRVPTLRVVEHGPDVRLAVAQYVRAAGDRTRLTRPARVTYREEDTRVRTRPTGRRSSGAVASAAGNA